MKNILIVVVILLLAGLAYWMLVARKAVKIVSVTKSGNSASSEFQVVYSKGGDQKSVYISASSKDAVSIGDGYSIQFNPPGSIALLKNNNVIDQRSI